MVTVTSVTSTLRLPTGDERRHHQTNTNQDRSSGSADKGTCPRPRRLFGPSYLPQLGRDFCPHSQGHRGSVGIQLVGGGAAESLDLAVLQRHVTGGGLLNLCHSLCWEISREHTVSSEAPGPPRRGASFPKPLRPPPPCRSSIRPTDLNLLGIGSPETRRERESERAPV